MNSPIVTDPRKPRVFISYSHDSEEHSEAVLDLCELLRESGVDAWIDVYDEIPPPRSWPRWMYDQIEAAKFVLVVCTGTYERRLLGREDPSVGRGATWEGAIVTQEMYESDSGRIIPVLLKISDRAHIPYFLRSTTHYLVGSGVDASFNRLLRHILGQPAVIPRPVGNPPVFDSRGHQAQDGQRKAEKRSSLTVLGDFSSPWRRSKVKPDAFSVRQLDLKHLNAAVMEALRSIEDPDVSGDTLYVGLRTSLTSFAAYIEQASGSAVRAALFDVFLEADAGAGLEGIRARQLASNSVERERRGPEGATISVMDATDFESIFLGQPWWVSDDLQQESRYRNPHFEQHLPSRYLSSLVLPVKLVLPDDDRIQGFLTIDSPMTGTFTHEAYLQDAQLFAGVLAHVMTLWQQKSLPAF
jgi:hypothetical protein